MPRPKKEMTNGLMASYGPKNFQHLLGTPGFSDTLLKNHFSLYEGYVKNTNQLLQELDRLLNEGKEASPAYAELSRRFGWEFNGMRLHEYYFGNMTRTPVKFSSDSELGIKIAEEFGSYQNWEKDFKATGAMRGIGWAALYYDLAGNRLLNVWIDEHNTGHPASCVLILIMDVFEHAFMTDYGVKRADYITAFFKALDWKEAQSRYDAALLRATQT